MAIKRENGRREREYRLINHANLALLEHERLGRPQDFAMSVVCRRRGAACDDRLTCVLHLAAVVGLALVVARGPHGVFDWLRTCVNVIHNSHSSSSK
jgi:hypothetical protein